MIDMLSLGVQLIWNLVTRVEENVMRTFGQSDLTSFQMSRFVETYIRGCQDHAGSNMQDMQNILNGSLLDNEQDGEPVILQDEEQFPDEGLTDDEWNHHLLLEEPTGSMFTTNVQVFSDSVFCTGRGALDPVSASKSWDEKAEAIMKSDNHGTCVRVAHQCKDCTSCKKSCRRLGARLRVFQTGSSS